MKATLKTILMLVILVCGILYVDLTVNTLLGTPRIMVIEYAKQQIFDIMENVTK